MYQKYQIMSKFAVQSLKDVFFVIGEDEGALGGGLSHAVENRNRGVRPVF